jgi:hypothetical protein
MSSLLRGGLSLLRRFPAFVSRVLDLSMAAYIESDTFGSRNSDHVILCNLPCSLARAPYLIPSRDQVPDAV